MNAARTLVRVPSVLTAGILAAASLAACSSSGSGAAAQSGQTSSPTTASPPSSSNAVTATETEFHIALSSTSLKAGTVTFRVKNAGSITHALSVDGPGVHDKSTPDIAPGESDTLTVTLKPGKYDVFCPVGNHRMEGMDETVRVT